MACLRAMRQTHDEEGMWPLSQLSRTNGWLEFGLWVVASRSIRSLLFVLVVMANEGGLARS